MNFKKEPQNDCALHIDSSVCTPIEVLKKLESEIDKGNNKSQDKTRDKEIGGITDTQTNQNTADELIQKFKEYFGCKNELCVIENDKTRKILGSNIVNKIIKENFKPEGPKYTSDWLSNFNIDEYGEQLMKKYNDGKNKYYHINFQMRDFAELESELYTFDFKKMYDNGYRTFGVVFNTDYSTGGGIHWFPSFFDFRDDADDFTLEYFNSTGESPLPEIRVWMEKTADKLNKMGFNKDIFYVQVTKIVNQSDTYSCGAYSIYYLHSRLEGIDYKWFSKNKIGDSLMVEFREYAFRDKPLKK